jgi:hypothetical protein
VIEVIESRSIVIRIVCLSSQRSPRESNLSDSWVYYFIIFIIILLFFYYYYYLKDALFLPSLIYWDA